MGYSGDPQNLADQTRLLLGDTDNAQLFLSDIEVQWLLDHWQQSPIRAAYQGAVWLTARFTRKVNITVGPTTVDYAGLAQNFRLLAVDLRAAGGGPLGTESLPGAPLSDNVADPFETDQGSWANTRWY
jgi:hypothetical protein